MSSQEEITPPSETSAALNEDEEQTAVKKGKKPFIEPTVSISLNILDATAFFGGSAAIDSTDIPP